MIEVCAAGPLTTIQDVGRRGHQSLGVPVSGALDQDSLRLANILCGLPAGAPAFEATYAGLRLRFHVATAIAVAGSDLGPTINGHPIERHRVHAVAPGDELSLSGGPGVRCYIAVAGGLLLEPFLGSCSAYLRGGFPGLNGRALRAGDMLQLRRAPGPEEIARLATLTLPPWFTIRLPTASPVLLRAVPGPQDDHFDQACRDHFFSATWVISRESDRMGCRLEGAPLPGERAKQIISDGAALGSVQIPGNGLPIILLADRQPTGGYPKIATVISSDVNLIAHCPPGTAIRFVPISQEEALAAARQRESDLRRLIGELAVARATRLLRLSVDGRAYDVALEQLDR